MKETLTKTERRTLDKALDVLADILQSGPATKEDKELGRAIIEITRQLNVKYGI
jgi:hypothetical protein